MKKILLLLVIGIGLMSCAKKEESTLNPNFLYNETCVIKKINEDRKTWLIQRTSNPQEFAELYVENDPTPNSCECGTMHTFLIPAHYFYNKKIGDNVYFDYILKDRFFIIENFEESVEPIEEVQSEY